MMAYVSKDQAVPYRKHGNAECGGSMHRGAVAIADDEARRDPGEALQVTDEPSAKRAPHTVARIAGIHFLHLGKPIQDRPRGA